MIVMDIHGRKHRVTSEEQMIVEMERAIHKRDVIALKLEPKAWPRKKAERGLRKQRGNVKWGNGGEEWYPLVI
jgi:hypothetical protein